MRRAALDELQLSASRPTKSLFFLARKERQCSATLPSLVHPSSIQQAITTKRRSVKVEARKGLPQASYPE